MLASVINTVMKGMEGQGLAGRPGRGCRGVGGWAQWPPDPSVELTSANSPHLPQGMGTGVVRNEAGRQPRTVHSPL